MRCCIFRKATQKYIIPNNVQYINSICVKWSRKMDFWVKLTKQIVCFINKTIIYCSAHGRVAVNQNILFHCCTVEYTWIAEYKLCVPAQLMNYL